MVAGYLPFDDRTTSRCARSRARAHAAPSAPPSPPPTRRLPYHTVCRAVLAAPRLFKKIMEDEVVYPAFFSASLVELLEGLLQKNPTRRYTCVQIRESGWFREGGPLPDGLSVDGRTGGGSGAGGDGESGGAVLGGADDGTMVEVGMRRPELIRRLQDPLRPPEDYAGITSALELIGRVGGVLYASGS